MKIVIFCTLLLSIAPPLFAVTPNELVQKAERDYQAGRYAEAIKSWQTLSEIGFVNANIFYNLANAYWRMGQVGNARVNFEKAKRYAPRDSDIRANLEFTSSPSQQAAAASGPMALLRKIPFYRLSLNGSESLILTAILSSMIFGLLLLRTIMRNKAYLVFAAVLLAPFLWTSTMLTAHLYQEYFDRKGVITQPQANLLSAPVSGSPAEEKLIEGETLKIIKKQGDFLLVKTLGGRKGWLPKGTMEEI